MPATTQSECGMKVYHGLHPHYPHPGCVVTIGNFDGVHRGHQHLLQVTRETARQRGLSALVMTFEPLPMEFFRPEQAPARLSRLREKLCLLRNYGMDEVWVLPFRKALACMSAQAFIEQCLHQCLHARAVVVGDDFRFGHGREGDIAMLAEAGKLYGFDLLAQPGQCKAGQRISSTAVRQALTEGRLADAEALLGHPYVMAGRVIHGNKLGRKLGFPTANIALGRMRSPLHGIYAVEVGIEGEDIHRPAVASLGTRPTVDGSGRTLLEVHLFDFNRPLYGRHLQVAFRHYLRPEKHFADVQALIEQMHIDARQAKDLLKP